MAGDILWDIHVRISCGIFIFIEITIRSIHFAVYCFVSAFLFLCMSLIPPLLDIVLPLNESRPILPVHPGYYFVDEREYFFYIFLHAVVAWEITVTGIVAHDCMLLTYIEHVCSIFALVG